jgi:gliding motility-associated-like protein
MASTLKTLILLLLNTYSSFIFAQNCIDCSNPAGLSVGLVACYELNGNGNDGSGNGFNSLSNNSVNVSNRFSEPNKASSFNGTNQIIRFGDILDSVFCKTPAATFSVSGWAKTNVWAPYAGGNAIVCKAAGGSGPANQWQIGHDIDGKITAFVTDSAFSNYTQIKSSVIPVNQWFHYVLVFDGNLISAQRVKLYVNGVLSTTTLTVGSIPTTTTNTNQEVTIGACHTYNNTAGIGNPYNGVVDDVRIYNRALTNIEINQLYSLSIPTFTPLADKTICLGDSTQLIASGGTSYSWSPTTGLSNPNIANPYAKPTSDQQYIVTISNGICTGYDTVMVNVSSNCCATCTNATSLNTGLGACFPFNANSTDETSTAHDGTNTNVTLSSDRFGRSNSAYSFNGTSSKIAIPVTNLTNNNYTFSMWVKINVLPTSGNAFSIFSIGNSGPIGDQCLLLGNNYSGQTGFIATSYRVPAAAPPDRAVVGTLPTVNTWYHLVGIRNTANNKLSLYLNGVKVVESTITSATAGYDAPVTAFIGTRTPGNFQYFNGLIDDVRIYNRAMSDQEVSELYILKPISITSIPDKTICLGDSTQLIASGGTSYSWSPTTGLSNPNIANPYAKPTSDQQYIVTISNGSCSSNDTVMVSVNSNCCLSCTSPLPVNTGLVACFPLNGNANDETASPIIPTITGNVVLTNNRNGINNSAYDFTNSSSTKISYSLSSKLDVPANQSFTMSSWFYQRDTTVDQSVIATLNGANGKAYILFVGGTSWGSLHRKIVFRDYDGPSLNKVLISSSNNIQLNTWYHVAITIDKVTGLNTLYLNGSPIASVTIPDNSIITSPNFYIGNNSVNNWGITGKIDEVRIYNRALSASEVMQLVLQKDIPILSSISDKTICQGDSVQLIASGGTSYSWSPTVGLSNPNSANPYAKPTTDQQYIVTITNGACSITDTVMVYVSQNCCDICSDVVPLNTGLLGCYQLSGNADDLSGNANNGTANTLSYVNDRFNKTAKAGTFNGSTSKVDISYTAFKQNEFTYSAWVNATTQPSSGNYYCVLSLGNSTTDQAILIGNNSALSHVGFGLPSYNSDLTSVATPYTGTLPILNKWYHIVMTRSATQVSLYIDGAFVSSASTNGKTASYGSSNFEANIGKRAGTNAQMFNGKIDDVRIYNRALSSLEIQELYVMKPSGLPNFMVSNDTTICKGDSVQLQASGALTYTWLPNSYISNNLSASPFVKPLDTLSYTVTGQSGLCFSVDTVKVNVRTIPVDAGPNQTICAGDSVRLNPVGASTYAWYMNISLSDTSAQNPYAKPTDTTTYYVVGTTAGCSAVDSVTLSVNSSIVISAGMDTTICLGDSVMLTATGANTFVWSPHGTLSNDSISNPFAFPSDTTLYTVIGTSGGCIGYDSVLVMVKKLVVDAGLDQTICLGDSAQLSATGGSTYNWTPATSLSSSTIANPFAKPSDTTIYYVSASQLGCSALDSVRINVKIVLADAGLPQSICLGDSAQLQASGGTTYTWQAHSSLTSTNISNPVAKPVTTTLYYVDVSDGACSAKDSVEITITNTLNVNAGSDVSLCAGDSVQLLATGVGVTGFTWNQALGLTDSTIANPKAFPTLTSDYIVRGQSGVCYDMDTITISVNPIPEVDLGGDTTKCSGQAFTFDPTVTNADRFNWQPASEVDDPTLLNPTTFSNTTETFTLTVTNSVTGCSANAAILVNVQKPTASFSLKDTSSTVTPFVVTPHNTSYPLPLTYEWDIFDTVPAFYSDLEPTHTFTNPGIYQILLTVTDDLGCTDTTSKWIRLTNEAIVYVPNAFTPNGDGKNDVFEVHFVRNSILEMKGSIWNRWGSKVYEFGSPDYIWWDGTSDGVAAPDGVYYYTVEVIDLQQKKHMLHGTVTLLR